MREKLIEWILSTPMPNTMGMRAGKRFLSVAAIADHLIAKGVTIREEGRWKGAGMGDYRCSLCDETVSGNHHNYCPSCGAYMK